MVAKKGSLVMLASSFIELSQSDKQVLLKVAKQSLSHACDLGYPLKVQPERFSVELQEYHPCFVSLHFNSALRGCVGSIKATHPLVEEVAENAWSSGFKDPRFAPITELELPKLDVEISILSKLQRQPNDGKEALIEQLEPGTGLIFSDGFHKAVFLPVVWHNLRTPKAFVDGLLDKGNWQEWNNDIQIDTFTTLTINDK